MNRSMRQIIATMGIWLLFVGAPLSAVSTKIQQFVDAIAQSRNNMHVGIKAVSLTQGHELCSLNEQCRFTPASNTKLFTALLAFEYMGPEYRFETQLMTDGTSVYLKADGDPSLTHEELALLISTLRDQHITTITGDFCIDTTAFDNVIFPLGSSFDNIGYAWNSPVTALSIDRKAAYVITPQGGVFTSDERLQSTIYDLSTALYAILHDNGIKLQGALVLRKTAEEAYVLATHYSEPLSVLVRHMMKSSDNLYANCFFKKVGMLALEAPGTWQKGSEAMKMLLHKMGIDPQDVIISDGAGLSRYNLIAPAHIITALQWAYQQPYFPQIFESFAIAGTDGSLKDRMQDLGTCIRGKTGTLSGVSALCGYACLPDDLVAFSILANGYTSQSIYNPPCKTEIEDAFCRFLAAELGLQSSAVA